MKLEQIINELEDLLREVLLDREMLAKEINEDVDVDEAIKEQYIKDCTYTIALKETLNILDRIRRLK